MLYQISEAQKKMNRLYKENGYLVRISNDYDQIIRIIKEYMGGARIPCKYCYVSKETYKKYFHKLYIT